MSRILVFGGHGKVARLLEPLLVERGDTVTAVIRNPEHEADVAATGATPLVADVEAFDLDRVRDLVAGHDAVVWSAGAGGGDPRRTYAVDRDAAIRTMDAAAAAGVPRYVMVSWIGSRPDHGVDPESSFFAYADAKLAADQYLQGSGLNWTILGPGSLTLEPPTGRISLDVPGTAEVSRADVAAVIAATLVDDTTIARTIRSAWGACRSSTHCRRSVPQASRRLVACSQPSSTLNATSESKRSRSRALHRRRRHRARRRRVRLRLRPLAVPRRHADRRAAPHRPRVRRRRRGGRRRCRARSQAGDFVIAPVLRLRRHLRELPQRRQHVVPATADGGAATTGSADSPTAARASACACRSPTERSSRRRGPARTTMIPSLLTLSDVMGTGHHAAVSAGVGPGDSVAVVGDGAVGLCAVIAAKRLGATTIIAMSRHAERQALAREFGATHIVEERGERASARVRSSPAASAPTACSSASARRSRWTRRSAPPAPAAWSATSACRTAVPSCPIRPLFNRNVGVNGGVAPVRGYIDGTAARRAAPARSSPVASSTSSCR